MRDRAIIRIRAAKQEQYTLFEGDRPLGALTREQLEAGFNLLQYTELSLNRRSVELLSLVRERERILGGAWLTYVGHKRPDTAIGLPLEEARTKAKILEDKIRGMAKPVPISLRLVQKQ